MLQSPWLRGGTLLFLAAPADVAGQDNYDNGNDFNGGVNG